MTDWDQIIEYMQNAIQAVDETHKTTEELRNHTTPEVLDEFRTQMQELCQHLTALQSVLEHQSTYSMDELTDMLSRYFSGSPAAFRRTTRIES